MKKSIYLFIVIVYQSFSLTAQINDDHLDWSTSVKDVGDDIVELVFEASIDDKYHLYSQFFDDGGPMKLSFSFDESDNYERIGNLTEHPAPVKEYDDIFGINVQYFKHDATFKQKIKVLSDKDFTIRVSLSGQSCFDDGSCFLVDEEFTFQVKGTALKKKENEEVISSNKVIENEFGEKDTEDSSLTAAKKTRTIPVIETKKIETDDQKTIELVENNESGKEKESLWWFFLLAIGGGFLGILTPCVFPMIPMTVTFFMNSSENRAKSIIKAIIYGLSIILLYTSLGALVSLTSTDADVASQISSNWIVNLIFFLVFLLFGASFLGMFELTLPAWMVNKADKQADKGGYLSVFFMAFTLVIVSFSCTGPIVGAILVEAAGGAVLKPILGMFGFSLAFALPFTLFAFFPSWLKKLPKSGGWLNTVKVVLGFIVLALGMKFLVIADKTMHWNILSRDVFIAIWIVLFSLLGLYLLGKIKFAHDSDLPYISVPRLALVIATFSFVVYMIPGLFGAPLKAISGFLPDRSSQQFNLQEIIRENASTTMVRSDKKTALCDKPKYDDLFHLPHGLEGYFDYEQALACAKKQDKPVFIDFTGLGCANCKKMEADVWSDKEVLRRLREDFIIVALYVDEQKFLPENEWYISEYDGKEKKTIGKKNADIRISKFKKNSQPYYFIINQQDEILSEFGGYNPNVDLFISFLEKGSKAYKKENE